MRHTLVSRCVIRPDEKSSYQVSGELFSDMSVRTFVNGEFTGVSDIKSVHPDLASAFRREMDAK